MIVNTPTTAAAVPSTAKPTASRQRRRNACSRPDMVGVLVSAKGSDEPDSPVGLTNGGNIIFAWVSLAAGEGVDGNAKGVLVDSEGMANLQSRADQRRLGKASSALSHAGPFIFIPGTASGLSSLGERGTSSLFKKHSSSHKSSKANGIISQPVTSCKAIWAASLPRA